MKTESAVHSAGSFFMAYTWAHGEYDPSIGNKIILVSPMSVVGLHPSEVFLSR